MHREVAQAYATLLPALNAQAWADQLAGSKRLASPSQKLGEHIYNALRSHYAPERLVQEHITAYTSTTT